MAVERPDEPSYPTNSISKEDLIYARPDLEETIASLSDEQMQQIADRVGEIIKDEYWSAIDAVLSRSFGEEGDEYEDDVAGEDSPSL
jgi:hypothetical protein